MLYAASGFTFELICEGVDLDPHILHLLSTQYRATTMATSAAHCRSCMRTADIIVVGGATALRAGRISGHLASACESGAGAPLFVSNCITPEG